MSPPTDADASAEIAEALREAAANAQSVVLAGGGTKRFLGRRCEGAPALDVSRHAGIVSYEPTELVISARAGTRLAEVEEALAARRQMLAFEPPRFGPEATLGGTIAAGLSGPRRPYAGAARDFTLGVKILNGKAQALTFGGQVMKNVAGYDVSRLMVGAFGTLGVVLEVSLKVLPQPAAETTLAFEHDAEPALRRMCAWARTPLPLSATCHVNGVLWARLCGTESGVKAACERLGGERRDDASIWSEIREQTHDAFAGNAPLWRLSVPATAPPIDFGSPGIIEWGGAQRWVRSDRDPRSIREAVASVGGHATLFRDGGDADEVFHPLSPGLERLHRRLKHAFDPDGLINRGRLYPDL